MKDKGFDFEWLMSKHYEQCQLNPSFRANCTDMFLRETGMNREWFKGQLCLDAGCGNGRWSYTMKKLGANVISIDVSDVGLKMTKETAKTMVMKEDLMRLSKRLKGYRFDFIYSSGVLHHTVNPRIAFDNLVGLLKRDGIIFIMIYEYAYPHRIFLIKVLKKIMTRFSDRTVWNISGVMARIASNDFLYSFFRFFLLLNKSQFSNYDYYSAKIQHYYKESDISKWFEDNDLTFHILRNSYNYSYEDIKNKTRGMIRVIGKKMY